MQAIAMAEIAAILNENLFNEVLTETEQSGPAGRTVCIVHSELPSPNFRVRNMHTDRFWDSEADIQFSARELSTSTDSRMNEKKRNQTTNATLRRLFSAIKCGFNVHLALIAN